MSGITDPDPTAASVFTRFGAIHRAAVRAEWDAAREAGLDIVIREDDQTLFGAASSIQLSNAGG